jgi:uncharacterized protein
MQTLDFTHSLVAFAAAFAAGLVNALAGGGTLITFPTMIWLGLNSVTANATSTVALWPFNVGATIGYWKEVRSVDNRMHYLNIPSAAGGLAGAFLLRLTPTTTFDVMVPYLILFATFLFMGQNVIQRVLNIAHPETHKGAGWFVAAMFFQLFVGLYGGYFGAGIGIMMLAALSILGMTDIHEMNALKNILGGSINAVAAIYFIAAGMVYWPYVGITAAGSIVGGYAGAKMARKIGEPMVRKIVVLVGFGMAISLFLKH